MWLRWAASSVKVSELLEYRGHLFYKEGPATETVSQRLAFEPLHDEVRPAVEVSPDLKATRQKKE